MNNWLIRQKVDLAIDMTSGIIANPTWQEFVQGDYMAHVWEISVYRDREPVDMSGAIIEGFFRLANTQVVYVLGTAQDNVIRITLPQECYAIAGPVKAIARATLSTESRVTLSMIQYHVAADADGEIIDPDDVIPSIADLLALVEEMREVTDEAEAVLEEARTATGNANAAAGTATDAGANATAIAEKLGGIRFARANNHLIQTTPGEPDIDHGNIVGPVNGATMGSHTYEPDAEGKLNLPNVYNDLAGAPKASVSGSGILTIQRPAKRSDLGLVMRNRVWQEGTPTPDDPKPILGVVDRLDVGATGINLWEPGNYEDIDATGTGTMRRGHTYPGGATYTISHASPTTITLVYRRLISPSGVYGETLAINMGVTMPVPDGYKLIIYALFDAELDAVSDMQVELGEVATPYIPYTGSIHTHTLLKKLWDGSYDSTGKMTRDGDGITANGTEDWAVYRQGEWTDTYVRFQLPNTCLGAKALSKRLCSRLVIGSATSEGYYPNTFLTHTSGTLYVAVEIAGVTDLASWKAYLAANPMTFYWDLATPEIIQDAALPIPAPDDDTAHVWSNMSEMDATYTLRGEDVYASGYGDVMRHPEDGTPWYRKSSDVLMDTLPPTDRVRGTIATLKGLYPGLPLNPTLYLYAKITEPEGDKSPDNPGRMERTAGVRAKHTGGNLLSDAWVSRFLVKNGDEWISDKAITHANSTFDVDIPTGAYTITAQVKSPAGANYRLNVLYADGTADQATPSISTGDYVLQTLNVNPDKIISQIRLTMSTVAGIGGTVGIKELMWAPGTMAKPYTPYTGQDITIPIGQEIGGQSDYPDIVDFARKVLRIGTAKTTLLSGLTYSYYALDIANDLVRFAWDGFPALGVGATKLDCTHLPYNPATSGTGGVTDVQIRNGNASNPRCWMFVRASMLGITADTSANDAVALFAAWLDGQNIAGTPIDLLYRLATPIEIPLSDATLSELAKLVSFGDEDNLHIDWGEIEAGGWYSGAGFRAYMEERIAALNG